ncbi:MAG: ATP-binding protein [Nitrospirae bacterium]|nr:ATP-binding protein [Nitrospirota bacterium]MCL5420861.1 ATP-binding protein [Nitrospirota bacterium]
MTTFDYILKRIESKKADYTAYDFTRSENDALKTFYDLAQEFDSPGDFYLMCVAIPKAFFNLEARLYLIEPKRNELSLMAKTEDPEKGLHTSPPEEVRPAEHPYYTWYDSLVLTIRGKKLLIDQLPFKTQDDVLGLLEVYPVRDRSPHTELFFEKYANRIGFNIHNRFLFEKNIEHLRFIRTLVADIEHNIIAPNMIYKLYLKHLRKKVMKNLELEKLLTQYSPREPGEGLSLEHILAELTEVNQGLVEEMENIEKHYQNMSLFLETLFRRSHFDKGRLTLKRKPCNMKKDVVQPQLERFAGQFRDMGIAVDDRLSGIPDEEVISVVDVGLMAQVYANLFSNALKYAQEVVTESGERKKYVSYGREVIGDCFGAGQDGIKYNVFSTGPHIPPQEREKIFEDEYRGSNVLNRPGTGHGLAFIRNVVEIHGGIVGYEATQYGNNFYFILPK